MFLPTSAWLLYHGLDVGGVSPSASAALFVGGFTVWTLTEYWLHRLFFHWKPSFEAASVCTFWFTACITRGPRTSTAW